MHNALLAFGIWKWVFLRPSWQVNCDFQIFFVLVAKSNNTTQVKPKTKSIFPNYMLLDELVLPPFDRATTSWCNLKGVLHNVYRINIHNWSLECSWDGIDRQLVEKFMKSSWLRSESYINFYSNCDITFLRIQSNNIY